MRVEVAVSAAEAASFTMQGSVAVVIDVLRATTVITTAIANGAVACYPVVEVEEAFALANEIRKNNSDLRVLLSGERGAVLIPGFDLANSPLEFTTAAVSSAHIVMTTSNGTRALVAARGAEFAYIACLRNAATVARALGDYPQVILICSGTADRADISDFLAAGAIITELATAGVSLELSDLAAICYAYYDPLTLNQRIRASFHGQRLLGLGLGDDLDYCCQLNVSDTLPVFDGHRITPKS
ncbi:MAG: 2-phosphosulfolactate phosphatase [Symbiobacteriaceae bacterium]|nr:2-phosphosulfolactate phosphatase [Symbiobacteriaceae bacterium]